MPQLSIIIPTRDREAIFHETLQRATDAMAGLDAEIIVVNDSKTRQVIISPLLKNVHTINNTGQGVASARNNGASIAQADLLLFLDDDMWISGELLLKAIQLNAEHPFAVFNFNWEYPAQLRELIQQQPFGRFLESIQFTTMKGWCRGMDWYDHKMFATTGLAGATLLIPKEIYFEVKGYDESFPLAGAEDHDFSARLIKSGYKAYIYPMIKAWHNEVNKTSLRGFLQRTYNNAITHRHATNLGYLELAVNYSTVKRTVYTLMRFLNRPLLFITDHWINNRAFDFLYFKLCHLLVGYYVYKGYHNQHFEN